MPHDRRVSVCDTITESTRMMLNGLSRWYHGPQKRPFLTMPHYEGPTTADMFLAPLGSTVFAELMEGMTKTALESGCNKCSIYMGTARGVVTFGEDMNEILVDHADKLHTEESLELFDTHFRKSKSAPMSFQTKDPRWDESRGQIASTVARLTRQPKPLIKIVQNYINGLKNQLATETPEFNLKEMADSFTLEVIIKGFLGAKDTPLELRTKLAKLIGDGVDAVVQFNTIAKIELKAMIPFLYQPRLPSIGKLHEVEQAIKQNILGASVWEQEEDNWLIERINKEVDQRALTSDIPRDQLKKQVINDPAFIAEIANAIAFFLTAGSETTAKHVMFTFLEVIQHPDKLEKIRQELSPFGDIDSWDEGTFNKVPYLDKVVKESIRLHPPLPYRKVKVEIGFTTKDGTEFKPGDHIFLNIGQTQRLATNYKDPLEFNPDREEFKGISLNDSLSQARDPVKNRKDVSRFQPFGIGKRTCPGARLATMEAKIMIACFVRALEMRLTKQWNDDQVETTFSKRPIDVPSVQFSLRP